MKTVWIAKTTSFGATRVSIEVDYDTMVNEDRYIELLDQAFGGFFVSELLGTPLARTVETGEVSTGPWIDNDLGILSAVAKPLGSGRFEVVFEMAE